MKSLHNLTYRAPVRVNPRLLHPQEQRISLDGEWRFRLDPADEGVGQDWFARPRILREAIIVPGCWQGQGFGGEGEDEAWDFRVQARVFRATYEGTGWYGKSFRPPAQWRGSKTWLNFGGVHPAADVWLNSKRLGSHSAPFVPFAFDVTDLISFERDNFLAVRVHEKNRWLGLAYNWQGKWSGLYRSVELTATGDPWLERLWILADVDNQALRLRTMAEGNQGAREPLSLVVSVKSETGEEVAKSVVRLEPGKERRFSIRLDSPLLWSPDTPNLYQVDALLHQGGKVLDAQSERVGLVKLSTSGKHFLINGEPYYLRGSGDFNVCPESGCPDTDRERWRTKLGTLRQYGYNYVRCQSYVPTPEYYDVADEVGLLIQGEMGMLGAWGGLSTWRINRWPQPRPGFREPLKWQWDRTVMRDVNHPSAAIYCMSNELIADTMFPRTAWQCYRDTKGIKPSAFVLWTDGGHSHTLPGDFINAEAYVENQYALPVIQHEFRWWSSYPDIRAKRKFRGAVRPYHIELAQRAAAANRMASLLPTIAENSQRLQYVEARTKLERCRRDNPTLAGICHFSATDIYLSPQGVLDEFYETKCLSPDTWKRTWGDTVLLLDRDFDDRMLAGGDSLRCTLFVSDFSHPPLKRPALQWEFWGDERRLAGGQLPFRHRPFCTCRAGAIEIQVPQVSRPLHATLRATLREGSRACYNEWDFWAFPREAKLPPTAAVYSRPKYSWLKQLRDLPRADRAALAGSRAPGVVLAEAVDDALVEYMRKGGRLLLAAAEGLVRSSMPKLGFADALYFDLPPANYPPLEDGNSGTIIAHHPMLGDFPHDGFADLQLFRPIAYSPPLDLVPFGNLSSEPIIRALSTYYVCHPLSYLSEFALGKGGLIICALNLNQKWPEARCLLGAILRHAAGRDFQPKDALSNSALRHLLQEGALP